MAETAPDLDTGSETTVSVLAENVSLAGGGPVALKRQPFHFITLPKGPAASHIDLHRIGSICVWMGNLASVPFCRARGLIISLFETERVPVRKVFAEDNSMTLTQNGIGIGSTPIATLWDPLSS